MNALIGYTGFVGSNIKNQQTFQHCYNTKNINNIKGKTFDTVVWSGVSGVKFLANQNPKKDFDDIESLIKNIQTITFKKFILISTLSVYDNPADNGYGRNRLYLENYIRNNYHDYLIVRLPGLFGKGLKKNALYDLLNKNYQYSPNKNSTLQYYNLDNLWKDINCALDNNLSVLNIGTEPIVFSEILDLFSLDSNIFLSKNIVVEDMRSQHAKYWGKTGDYLYSKQEMIYQLKHFIQNYKL